MKLKKIKLAGFKSFVDPTTIELKSSLTGIVGPNGCGKSNIIDAVRWVMGEISAKQLRGGSMSDVIFSGSSARKPVGKATVEVVFDNSDASLGGEYAKYSEIAIRREVDRNGFSDYFLNDSSCRRKDIIDIFLGTGLGPRSYAIIEQGMISKIIEARPEDLRIMIEEAAGISKYKERRRETELRIKHTKENLLRLTDIRGELEKQLKTLKSQASAAERYKKFKQEERLTKAQIHALHSQSLEQKLINQEEQIKACEMQLEDKITNSHALEAKLAQIKEQRSISADIFNKAQESYYAIGSDVTILEQQIKHIDERREQLTKDLAQANQVWQETLAHQITDQGQIELLTNEKIQLESQIAQIQQNSTKSQQELSQAEQQMQVWQKNWDSFNTNAAQVSQKLGVEQTKMQHLEQKITQETKTAEKFKKELNDLDFNALANEVNQLNQVFSSLKTKNDDLHNDLNTRQQQITKQRETNSNLNIILDQIRNKLQNANGQKASLEVLQQAALGKNDAVLVNWLKQHNLDKNPRLAQELKVIPGWEKAVETVLGMYLEAICVDDIDNVTNTIQTLTHGNLVLFDTGSSGLASRHKGDSIAVPCCDMISLSSKITSNLTINNLLHGIYAVENINQALAARAKLNDHESIVTQDGIWLAKSWVRVAYDAKQKTGVLQRERQLSELNQTIKQEQENLSAQSTEFDKQKSTLITLEREYQELQQQLRLITKEYSEAQSKLSSKQAGLQHMREREQNLTQQIKLCEQNLQNETKQLETGRQNLEQVAVLKTNDDSARSEMTREREQIGQKLNLARNLANQKQQELNNNKMRLQVLQKQIDYLTQSLTRASQSIESSKERHSSIEVALAKNKEPLANLKQELQVQLERRLKLESDALVSKQQVSNVEYELTSLEKQYGSCQEEHEKIRDVLEKLRTDRAELQVRSSTYQEQIHELEFNLDELIASMPEEASITPWEEKLAHLSERIARLGLINLAAIEEFEKLGERKNYLDLQDQDLVSALNTLEDAIRKIDNETKDRFREAYESINTKFQELFPKIFNGGRAYLEQNSQNLLETGVVIMAQPPGKRNASIQLLSGGEKTLTAISLIFAIFELTPAPFCMLDEVDAPLDDVNVSRFCNLVTEMAKTVQFIFITHNKLTMEIAGQLVGITMQEAGVSRIVTVDLDTAAKLAGADK